MAVLLKKLEIHKQEVEAATTAHDGKENSEWAAGGEAPVRQGELPLHCCHP